MKLACYLVQQCDLFRRLSSKKQISTRVYVKGSYHTVIGTLWEFAFNQPTSKTGKQLIQFALDSGIGELNSLGFGFMNLIKRKLLMVLVQALSLIQSSISYRQ
jgi:CRISPR-associated endoribonuclease Cas6